MGLTKRLILLALPLVLACVVLLVILNWHVPTRIRIILKTNRVVFTVAGDDTSTILDSLGLKTVIIERFESVVLRPEKLAPVSVRNDSGSSAREPRSGGMTPTQQPVLITPSDGRSLANVTISAMTDGSQGLVLMDSVRAKPLSEVTLESTEDADLTLRIDGQQSSGKITAAGPLLLSIDQCQITGVSGTAVDQPLTLKAQLRRDSSIEFSGQQKSMVLTVTAPTDKVSSLFPEGPIPISAVRFERLDGADGRILSSLLRDSSCEISYPDYQKIDKAVVSNPDFLSLADLRNFSIQDIRYEPDHKGIAMTLHGVAGKITSGSPSYLKDHRLTVYDSLWNDHTAASLFVALCWVAAVTAAFYKLFKGER